VKNKSSGLGNCAKNTVSDAYLNNEKYQIFDYHIEQITSQDKSDLLYAQYACGCSLRSDYYFIPSICLQHGAPAVNIMKKDYDKKERLRRFYKNPSAA